MEPGVQREYAPNSICYGCGPANKKGLRIDSHRCEEGLEMRFMPDEEHQAFPGMIVLLIYSLVKIEVLGNIFFKTYQNSMLKNLFINKEK